jgi:hypothetical protein
MNALDKTNKMMVVVVMMVVMLTVEAAVVDSLGESVHHHRHQREPRQPSRHLQKCKTAQL